MSSSITLEEKLGVLVKNFEAAVLIMRNLGTKMPA